MSYIYLFNFKYEKENIEFIVRSSSVIDMWLYVGNFWILFLITYMLKISIFIDLIINHIRL